MEIITWGQLGIHRKNVGILNTAGYFDGLLNLIDHAIAEKFIRPEHRELLVAADTPAQLLSRLDRHEPPMTRKWFRADEM